MRIDHRQQQSVRPVSPSQYMAPSQSAVVFVPNADTMWATFPDGSVDEDYNPNSYPGEWIEMRDGQLEDSDFQEDRSYVLSCGAEEEDESVEEESECYVSPLPSYPPTKSSHSPRRRLQKSNGCGAIVHVNAIPRRRCGVWMAKEGGTDAVVGMDASYFDRSAVIRMMKSTCGCIREGIGCSVWQVCRYRSSNLYLFVI
jgi:hypothetical protein